MVEKARNWRDNVLEGCKRSVYQAGKFFDLTDCVAKMHKGRRRPQLVSAVRRIVTSTWRTAPGFDLT